MRIPLAVEAGGHEMLNPIQHRSDSQDHLLRNGIRHNNSVQDWRAFVCGHVARTSKTVERRPQRRVILNSPCLKTLIPDFNPFDLTSFEIHAASGHRYSHSFQRE